MLSQGKLGTRASALPAWTLCADSAASYLDEAWVWLCRSRKNAPYNADIWHLRFHWHTVRNSLLRELLAGRYRLTPMTLCRGRREDLALWSAQDALVLKWVALCIQPRLSLPARCEHVKGHGGGSSSVARMTKALQAERYPWVCRTDVKGYYGSMVKKKLLACVNRQVHDPVLRGLVAQYVHYTVEEGGEFYTPEKGIARGCALSPLMGALYLAQMDEQFSRQGGIYYARYMDDVVILAKTRWQLRRHVRALNRFFEAGEVEQHPDKTFIGRTERGFDWMGAQMGDAGVEGIAHRAMANYGERLRRLYEQFRGRPAVQQARMSAYRKHWARWACIVLLVATPYASAYLSVDDVNELNVQLAKQTTVDRAGRRQGTVTLNLRSFGYQPWSAKFYTVLWNTDPAPRLVLTRNPIRSYVSNMRFKSTGTCDLKLPLLVAGVDVGKIVPVALDVGPGGQALPSARSTWIQGADSSEVNIGWSDSSAGDAQVTGDNYLDCPNGGQLSFDVQNMPVAYQPQWQNTSLVFKSLNYAGTEKSNGAVGLLARLGDLNVPPSPVPVLPVCTWGAPPSPTSLDFGTVSNNPDFGQWAVMKQLSPIPITAQCTSDAATAGVTLAVSAYTTGTRDGGGDTIKFQSAAKTENGLLLALAAPATAPAGVTFESGARAGGTNRLFFGTAGTPTPWWSWAVAARSSAGSTTLSPVPLTPQLLSGGPGNWTTDMYDKDLTAPVVLILETK